MNHPSVCSNNARELGSAIGMAVVFVALLMLPDIAMATVGGKATGRVESFFKDIKGLLGAASLAVVTIAVIFAGYQIAFAHKRISDVAPILIGGFLIGAAGQVAGMLLDDNKGLENAGLSTYEIVEHHA